MVTNSIKIIGSFFVFFLFVFLPARGQEKKADSGFTFHSVEKKETIYSIARKHNVTVEDIYQYNPSSKNGIKTGEVLQIPEKITSVKAENPKELSYKVSKGESLYFIAKKFNCTQEDLLKLNPGLSSAPVEKGMILKVPNPDYKPIPAAPKISAQDALIYKIQNGDTYYNLKKRFGVEKEALEKINPELKNGLKEGLIIKIPIQSGIDQLTKDKQTTEQPARVPDKQNAPGNFNIGLYLPFKAELNDSSRITAHTANYLEFYEGAILATDNLINDGLKIKLYVYDTNQDPKVVEQLVKKPEFLSLDLIIGPVYPESQKVMSDLSGKNHIPMVSPLSPDNRFVSGNPYYYQINPDKKLRLSGTADYVLKESAGKNIIFLGSESNNNGAGVMLSKLKQHLTNGNFHLYDLWNDARSGIETQLNPEKENIVVMTEPDEARVSVAVTRLNTESKKFRITLVGLQEYTRMQSINTEYLHNLNLHYLSPYYVDYSDEKVIRFVEKFRSNFGAEPTQYAFQGYDVVTGFIKGLQNSGKKVFSPGNDLLQADYNFQRISAFGGSVNTSFFIIRYSDTYEIQASGKIKVSLTAK